MTFRNRNEFLFVEICWENKFFSYNSIFERKNAFSKNLIIVFVEKPVLLRKYNFHLKKIFFFLRKLTFLESAIFHSKDSNVP